MQRLHIHFVEYISTRELCYNISSPETAATTLKEDEEAITHVVHGKLK